MRSQRPDVPQHEEKNSVQLQTRDPTIADGIVNRRIVEAALLSHGSAEAVESDGNAIQEEFDGSRQPMKVPDHPQQFAELRNGLPAWGTLTQPLQNAPS